MSSEIYKCKYCIYNSNRLYNFKRHMMTKHKEINYQHLVNNKPNVMNDKQNVMNDKQNVMNDKPNVMNDKQNVMNDNECYKCNKILSSKQNLNKHLLICKGVSNPLECHLCHKIFANRGSKSTHIKICKGIENSKELITIENNNTNDLINTNSNNIINTNSNNIITTNSNNVINTNNYNINLISYNKEDRKIEFDISHMNKNLIYKLRTMHENDAYVFFCYKLFENKNNQMIIKTNLRHIYSNVHLGFNIWEKILDNNIYHIIIYYISEIMNKYIIENTTIQERDDTKLGEILFYIKMMYSKLSIVEKYPRKYEKYYKNNIESLKLQFSKFDD